MRFSYKISYIKGNFPIKGNLRKYICRLCYVRIVLV